MRIKRTLAFTKKVLKQLRHDRRTFAFILIMPLLMIMVFGYTFGGDVNEVRVVVVNKDVKAPIIIPPIFGGNATMVNLTIGDYIEEGLDRDTLRIDRMDDLGKAKERVRRSQFFDKTWAVIYVPEEFSEVFAGFMQRTALAKTFKNQTACEGTGLFWYGGSCNAFASSQSVQYDLKEDCNGAGFEWYNNKCHEDFKDREKWALSVCEGKGYFWYDSRCHDGADLTLITDASNPNIDGAIHISVIEAMLKAQKRIMSENPELKMFEIQNPISQRDDYAFGNGDIRFIDSFAPAIMAFAMMMVTTMITIFLFIEERKMGTLDRLLASPATEAEVVVGYAIAFSIVSLIQGAVILTAAIGLFGIYIAQPVLLRVLTAFVFLILFGMGHQGLGILLSSGAKNELQAIQFIPLIIFPSILLCGLFWPIESIPEILRPLSYLIPLTYAIDAVRSTMIRGLGFGELWCHASALIVFLIVSLWGAVMLLKKRR